MSVCQINWNLSKQELLFSDFCEDSDNIEEGAEYNKVVWPPKQHIKKHEETSQEYLLHVL